MNDPSESHELSPAELKEKLEAAEAQVVDVRRDQEYERGHIEGAIHIPLDNLPARSAEIDTSKPVVFCCRSGSRSSMAADAFRASGIEAYNLGGGLERWVDEGGALAPEGGEIAPAAAPDNS